MNKFIFAFGFVLFSFVFVSAFNPIADMQTESGFWVSDEPTCIDDGLKWSYVFGGNVSSLDNCRIGDAVCCPEDMFCNDDGVCEDEDISVAHCGDYLTEDDCNNYNINNVKHFIYATFLSDVEEKFPDLDLPEARDLSFCEGGASNAYVLDEGDVCNVYSGCRCEWDGGECKSVYDVAECDDGDDGLNWSDKITHSCGRASTTLQDLCSDEGYYLLDWESKGYAVDAEGVRTLLTTSERDELLPDCGDGSITFNCPSTTIVPFFGFFNFVVALGLIVVVYVLRKR